VEQRGSGQRRERSLLIDTLFDLEEHFSDQQVVEITALLTLVNLDRFNAAFGIGSAGFSDGMICVPPDRPTANPTLAEIA